MNCGEIHHFTVNSFTVVMVTIIFYKSIYRILSQFFNCETMSSESTVKLVNPEVGMDTAAVRKRNDDWIRAWRKANGVKKQATLPTKVEEHTAWVMSQGWSMRDANAWKGLCEKAKFSSSVPIDHDLDLLLGTLDAASQLDSHPIGLICFARCELKQNEWSLTALQAIRDRFMILQAVTEEDVTEPVASPIEIHSDHDEEPSSPGGKKRRFEHCSPTQHSDVSGEI